MTARSLELACSLLLLGNSIFLYLIGVTWITQVCVCIYVALLALAGAFWLGRIRQAFSDPIAFCVASFFLGMIGAFILCFAFFHQQLCDLLGFETLVGPSLLVTLILIPFALIALVRISRWTFERPLAWAPICLCLALALLLVSGTVYGFQNSKGSAISAARVAGQRIYADWGTPTDKGVHLLQIPIDVITEKLPSKSLSHIAAQIILLHIAVNLRVQDQDQLVKVSKAFIGFVAFGLVYFAYWTAVSLFGLSELWGCLTALATVFLAPVTNPFRAPELVGYMTAIASSRLLYHNTNQLFVVPMGLVAAYLVGKSWQRGFGRCFPAGCAFAAGSFFFKPSIYMLLAPAVCLMLPFVFRRLSLSEIVAGVGILVVPVVFWTVYPVAFGIEVLDATPVVRPFALYLHYAMEGSPGSAAPHPLAFAMGVLASSFLFLLPPVLERCSRILTAKLDNWMGAVARLRSDPVAIFYILILSGGVASSVLLLERDPIRMWHGNYVWSAGAGILTAVPIFFRFLAGTPRGVWLNLSIFLLFLHFWSGILAFASFVTS